MKTRALILLFLVLSISSAFAEEAAAPVAEAKAEKAPVGLNIGFEISSIYNFRGYNVFGGGDQNAQNIMVAPSLTWTIFDTGLSLGWWSAYQAYGSNRATLVDTGYGHEQDVFLAYSKAFLDDTLILSAAFTGYLYPFASDNKVDDEKKPGTGTTCPVYLEPTLGLTYSDAIEIGLNLSYFAGIQDVLEDYRYFYINPRIAKTFEINKALGMRVALSYGYKVFNKYDKMKDNVHDIRFDYEIPITALKPFVITPNIHTGWSNFEGQSIGEEYMIYGGLRLGYDF